MSKTDLGPVIRYLTESHLAIQGGYSSPYMWIGDTFIWAEDDFAGKAISLHTMTRQEMAAWHDEAREYAAVEGYQFPPAEGNWDADWEPFYWTRPGQEQAP